MVFTLFGTLCSFWRAVMILLGHLLLRKLRGEVLKKLNPF